MLIAFLIAASVIFPTVFTAGSETGDAFAAQADQTRDQLNTEIGIESVEQEDTDDDGNGDETVVTAENTGTLALDLRDTDLLLNGQFVDPDDLETVVIDHQPDGEEERLEDTAIWRPGTDLEVTIDEDNDTLETEYGFTHDDLERVKLVTETGVSDAKAVAESEGS
ncbi:flagellin [Halobiforma nitratireducens JCM 10879]|uniref:Flagellin n=2 Tax=Halobiforma nitratireducens TaxID=130048 RepID=M0LFP2_9EURY|nr:flagellin [Halobiforma nitratireducens JCM 10879]